MFKKFSRYTSSRGAFTLVATMLKSKELRIRWNGFLLTRRAYLLS